MAAGLGDAAHGLSLEQVVDLAEVASSNQYLKLSVEWFAQAKLMASSQKTTDKGLFKSEYRRLEPMTQYTHRSVVERLRRVILS